MSKGDEIELGLVATIVVGAVAALGVCIAVFSLWYLCRSWSGTTNPPLPLFEAVVSHTLVPIFTSSIGAVLAWIFGKHIVGAIAARIRSVS
jgi:hypothetical protein